MKQLNGQKEQGSGKRKPLYSFVVRNPKQYYKDVNGLLIAKQRALIIGSLVNDPSYRFQNWNASNILTIFALPRGLDLYNEDQEMALKGAHLLGPCLESKFDELKFEILNKIDKEVTDSKNARDYISQKYDELCNKIQYLTELDSTVSGFRSDVKAIEKQIMELGSRVDDIEKRTISKECPSLTSSMFAVTK